MPNGGGSQSVNTQARMPARSAASSPISIDVRSPGQVGRTNFTRSTRGVTSMMPAASPSHQTQSADHSDDQGTKPCMHKARLAHSANSPALANALMPASSSTSRGRLNSMRKPRRRSSNAPTTASSVSATPPLRISARG